MGIEAKDVHDEIGVIFVDAIVAQVDARIIQATLIGRVLDGRKANDSVPVQIDHQRVIRRDGHVQAQIALHEQFLIINQ